MTAAPLSLDEFSQLPGKEERHEMSAGKLITTPALKSLHSRMAARIFTSFEACLGQLQSSRAFCHAGYVLGRDPLTIRQPDVSVLSKERIQSTGDDEYFEGAPELAVEVVSPSDSAEDLQIKVDQYLSAGAKQVWVLYPKTKCVHVFSATGLNVFSEAQTLQGGDLLREFSVQVSDLFL